MFFIDLPDNYFPEIISKNGTFGTDVYVSVVESICFFEKIFRGVFGIVKSSMGLLFSCFNTCLHEDIKPIKKLNTFFSTKIFLVGQLMRR
jgi:hypothetical protein